MKKNCRYAFIHSFRGKPWNEECQVAYNGFKKLGFECVLFTTNEEIAFRKRQDIVVGGMLIMSAVLDEYGIQTENYNYPDELNYLLGRRIWTTELKNLHNEKMPFFAKPVEEKIAQGIVINSDKDLSEYNNLSGETKMLCSEVVSFLTEWRCFIMKGKIIGIQHYKGDKTLVCNEKLIEKAVEKCRNFPSAYTLDFGVTGDGRTLLIEMNDGYSIGCYGLDDVLYAKFLYARWAELTGTVDECDF